LAWAWKPVPKGLAWSGVNPAMWSPFALVTPVTDQNSSNTDGNTPSRVRATAQIIDTGSVVAEPGDVGVVLDAVTEEDGTRALLVLFPDGELATTCVLGEDVEPVLAVAPSPPLPARPTRARRAIVLGGLTACAAAVVAVVFWQVSEVRNKRHPVPPVSQRAGSVRDAIQAAGLADIVTPNGGYVLHLDSSTVPAKPDAAQKRTPCNPELGETAIDGACYVVVGNMRPPCGKLFQWRNQCVRPVLAAPRPDASLRSE